MQMITYHPLIDGDTDGMEKVPMFLSTDGETIQQNSKLYLSESEPGDNFGKLTYTVEILTFRKTEKA